MRVCNVNLVKSFLWYDKNLVLQSLPLCLFIYNDADFFSDTLYHFIQALLISKNLSEFISYINYLVQCLLYSESSK